MSLDDYEKFFDSTSSFDRGHPSFHKLPIGQEFAEAPEPREFPRGLSEEEVTGKIKPLGELLRKRTTNVRFASEFRVYKLIYVGPQSISSSPNDLALFADQFSAANWSNSSCVQAGLFIAVI